MLLTNRVASITVRGASRDINVGGLTLGRFVSSLSAFGGREGTSWAQSPAPAGRGASEVQPVGEGHRVASCTHGGQI